jgi:hypothetical protein
MMYAVDVPFSSKKASIAYIMFFSKAKSDIYRPSIG